ncbi:hypothetical protein HJG54_29260 [Leptolyngbya sp. NK1-12]|uniref:DUF202 domain-containing protein n=1 Tax=Leptolyngbya sp. NK1-12 TaxID=2547451 RepID=A0AA96WKP2_9CYAN|nr:hypothetical protein [Leptolyngbya sp. NK1-12]WNZ27009.1 hypothetical protein HJG54_29260 [Leptolyngbya sp. NK1-12]
MPASEVFSHYHLPQSSFQSASQTPQQRQFDRQTNYQTNYQTRIGLSHSLLDLLRIVVVLTGFGLGIAAILAFQQLLIQIYFTCWQMALLFALIGLMVALLLGQFYISRRQIQAFNWSVMSSMTVTVFGLGVVLCIMSTTPGLT